MLNKLIKIDLRYILKIAPALFGLGFFFAILSVIFSKLGDSALVATLLKISQNFSLSFVISGFVNVLTRVIVVFSKKLYGDESYLTHTLPLSKKTIYLSKFLSIIYSALISVLLLVAILFINYNLFEKFDLLKTIIESHTTALGISPVLLISLLIIIFSLEILTLFSIVFLGTIINHRVETRKILFTVLSTGGTYLLIQGLFILSIFLFGLIDENVMGIFNSSIIQGETVVKVLCMGSVFYALCLVVLNVLNIKFLEKGVNVA